MSIYVVKRCSPAILLRSPWFSASNKRRRFCPHRPRPVPICSVCNIEGFYALTLALCNCGCTFLVEELILLCFEINSDDLSGRISDVQPQLVPVVHCATSLLPLRPFLSKYCLVPAFQFIVRQFLHCSGLLSILLAPS